MPSIPPTPTSLGFQQESSPAPIPSPTRFAFPRHPQPKLIAGIVLVVLALFPLCAAVTVVVRRLRSTGNKRRPEEGRGVQNDEESVGSMSPAEEAVSQSDHEKKQYDEYTASQNSEGHLWCNSSSNSISHPDTSTCAEVTSSCSYDSDYSLSEKPACNLEDEQQSQTAEDGAHDVQEARARMDSFRFPATRHRPSL